MTAPALAQLLATWRARAEQLAPYAAPAAEAFRTASLELEAAVRAADDELLTLSEAATESGFSDRTLRSKIAAGELTNHGAKHRPRIRRGDLPRKATAKTAATYDVDADARRLALR